MINFKLQLTRAKESSRNLRIASSSQKNIFLLKLADSLIENKNEIIKENNKDIEKAQGLTKAMLRRLTLTGDILKEMARGLRQIAEVDDPVGQIENMNTMFNGMKVGRMRVPIGVILFVYESRPNVIIDAAGLCIKSGNTLIVRGGKEAMYSNVVLLKYIKRALVAANLPENGVQQLEDRDYETLSKVVKETEYVDLIVPRGREKLISSIKEASMVPVIAHERGVCHAYVDSDVNIEKAIKIIINSKVSNPSTCNSLEKVLIHKNVADKILPSLIKEFINNEVEVRGDKTVCKIDRHCKKATKEDWDQEYLDLIITIKIVDSFQEALVHIENHSSGLSDIIITENNVRAQDFLNNVNSASVMVNASTRLTDGAAFGLGAELGISTSSIHMRGPMGLKDLTVTKYVVLGDGQIRE